MCMYRTPSNPTVAITFPPRRGLGGFPALTTLAGPVGSVETNVWR